MKNALIMSYPIKIMLVAGLGFKKKKKIPTLIDSSVLHNRRHITFCHYKGPGMPVDNKKKAYEERSQKMVANQTDESSRTRAESGMKKCTEGTERTEARDEMNKK